MSRLDDNKTIVGYIILAVKQNPDLRFEQILYNLGIVDTDRDYNLESSKTLNKVLEESIKNNMIDFNKGD